MLVRRPLGHFLANESSYEVQTLCRQSKGLASHDGDLASIHASNPFRIHSVTQQSQLTSLHITLSHCEKVLHLKTEQAIKTLSN